MGNLGFKITLIFVCTGMFFYVIRRLFTLFGNNSKIIPLIIALILAIFVMGTFMYYGDSKVLDIIGTIASRIVVLGFLLMFIMLIESIISNWYKINPRIIVGIIVLILGVGAFFSLHTKITYLNIETTKIQKDTKFLLVSDIHAENVMQDFHVNKIINMIESEKPDFVIIAGDLMNKANKQYLDYLKGFKSIKDTPIFAVIGNHDVMGDRDIVKEIPDISGIKLLNNESLKIEGIQIIGIIDKSLWGDSLEQTMNQINFNENPNLFTIFITHQPIGLEKLEDYPVDLEVAGHTHQGQFYGMRKVVERINDYAYGKYKSGDRTAFVTQGIGTWGLPFRLGTQSEMVIINLIKK